MLIHNSHARRPRRRVHTGGLSRRLLALCLTLCVCGVFRLPAFADEDGAVFSDVKCTAWYAASVSYAAANGIAAGSNGKFRPNDPVTRAEFVVMLAGSLAVEPSAEALPDNPFTDVPKKSYYYNAVLWAFSNGITTGTSADSFSPKAFIQRQDMALMLLKAQQLPQLGELPLTEEEKAFADQNKISRYARAAVRTLQLQGLFAGDGNGNCNPHGNLTRAEAATVLMRVHCFRTGHTHDYAAAENQAPTCTRRGIQYYRCDCGSFYGVNDAPALGHSYAEGETDLTRWSTVYTCTRCGARLYDPLPAQRVYDGDALISYDEALEVVDQLQALYPGLIDSYAGGQSVWGTDIRVVTLGWGDRYIFLNANIHASETITTNYLLKVLDEYAYAFATNGSIGDYQIQPLLNRFTLVMIPCSNPDGRAITLSGQSCKENANGVNLNENFPTNWIYDESGIHGESAGSEPETQTILSVLDSYPFELVLDCHSSGNAIYYADTECSDALRAESYRIASAIRAESGFGLYQYGATAGMANYARHPYGVPGLTIEMHPLSYTGVDCTRFNEYCWSRLSTMPAIVMNCLY